MTDPIAAARAALRKTIWDSRSRLASDIAPGIVLSEAMAAADRLALAAFALGLDAEDCAGEANMRGLSCCIHYGGKRACADALRARLEGGSHEA